MIEGTGNRLENETVILWNDAEDTATINTASPTVYRRLVKRGWKPVYENGIRARFEVPKSRVRIPTPKVERISGDTQKPRGFQRKRAGLAASADPAVADTA